MKRSALLDAVVVGGGPAGLSGALVLGRCRRTVVVVDSGRYRNASAPAVYGYLTRDGTRPATFRALARKDLRRYPTVSLVRDEVLRAARRRDGRFALSLERRGTLVARTVLLATGVVDSTPPLPGLGECFGRSVFPCPYCDAWEVRDRALAAIGRMPGAAGMAVSLRTWSDDVVLFADGQPVGARWQTLLRDAGVRVVRGRLAGLRHRGGRLRAVALRGGDEVPRDAVFLSVRNRKRAGLARDLGCGFTDGGAVEVDRDHATCVEGVHAAGDVTPDSQFVVVAAAEGARAAVAMNERLTKEDLRAARAASAGRRGRRDARLPRKSLARR